MPTPIHPKLQLFVISKADGRALSGVPVSIVAEVAVDTRSSEGKELWRAVLQSDHVGYLSLTLDTLRLGHQDDEVYLKLFLTPFFDDTQRIEFDLEALSWREPNPMVLPVTVPEQAPVYRRTYPSIELADVRDWRTSPLSFGTRIFASEAAGPCAPFLPSGATTFLSRFSEIAIDPSDDLDQLSIHSERIACENYFDEGIPDGPSPSLCYKTGRLIEYETSWTPINHGLGEILHSSTLAPCEQVNFAVIDWKRQGQSRRDEDQTLREELDHELRRDRTIEEVVEGAVSELQRGKSFLGGTAGTGGYGSQGNQGGGGSQGQGGGLGGGDGGGAGSAAGAIGGGNPFSWGVFGSHALGIGKSRSRGNRDVEVETTQNISDNIVQSANAVRRLRGTVVVQGTQAESESIQTRTIRNHNHCHALTVLFYEIVRHFHVATRATRQRPVLLLKYAALAGRFVRRFTPENALSWRWQLEPALLAPQLSPGFEALEHEIYGTSDSDSDTALPEAGPLVSSLRFEYKGSASGDRGWLQGLYRVGDSAPQPLSSTAATTSDDWTTMGEHTFDEDVSLETLSEVGYRFGNSRGGGRPSTYQISSFRVSYKPHSEDRYISLFDSEIEWPSDFPDDLVRREERLFPLQTSIERPSSVDPALGEQLVAHLNANLFYYNKALWLSEDPDERIRRLERYRFREGRLTDYIERDPLGVYGDYLVFLAGPAEEFSEEERLVCDDAVARPRECEVETVSAPPTVEAVVALPTRGAYAETKLSECNACETIDPTRFWKWQESPCPDSAPGISPIEAGSRYKGTDTDLSPLPNPVVNIQNAPSAPAPSGLVNALNLLGSSDIFRDMSGIDQLGPLLQKLADVAAGTGSEIMGTVREAHERNQLVRDARDRGEITEEQANEAIAENVEPPESEPEPPSRPRPRPTPDPEPDEPDPVPDPEPEPEEDPVPQLEQIEIELEGPWQIFSGDPGTSIEVGTDGASAETTTEDVNVTVTGRLVVRASYLDEAGRVHWTPRYRYLVEATAEADQAQGDLTFRTDPTGEFRFTPVSGTRLPDLLNGMPVRLKYTIYRTASNFGDFELTIPELGVMLSPKVRFSSDSIFDTSVATNPIMRFRGRGQLSRGRELRD